MAFRNALKQAGSVYEIRVDSQESSVAINKKLWPIHCVPVDWIRTSTSTTYTYPQMIIIRIPNIVDTSAFIQELSHAIKTNLADFDRYELSINRVNSIVEFEHSNSRPPEQQFALTLMQLLKKTRDNGFANAMSLATFIDTSRAPIVTLVGPFSDIAFFRPNKQN